MNDCIDWCRDYHTGFNFYGYHDLVQRARQADAITPKGHATGTPPDSASSHLIRGNLAVMGSHAHLLSKQRGTKRMIVYRLDLKIWRWDLLPCKGDGPVGVGGLAAAVAQVPAVL